MRSRLVLPASADRSEKWHEARMLGITASEIAVILGLSPFESEFSLFWRKLGELPPIEDNDSMSLGRHLESWVADKFAEDHPDFALGLGGLYASAERPWQMATPDRLVRRFGAGLDPVAAWEGKTSSSYDGWGLSGTDEVPVYYRAQALWQMDTLGVRRTYLSCLFLQSKQTRHYVIDYDETDVEVMRLAALDFMDRLTKGVPPPVDGSQAARDALKHLNSHVEEGVKAVVPQSVGDEYRDAYAAFREAKQRKDAAENKVRELAGSARIVLDPDGRRVCTRSIYEMPAHHREACTVDKLNPPRSKKDI
ncbi:YqaJ viral recombinase family protein [Streptosporangium sp. NBC_01755]|uniref:YqaJ viral recombinase family nuclease n=1 Tax=Streptosporangium sp. NBC_01755 TaxID=2975949 RepID=UPI002DD888E0|nr:YqaJ viral recombinase family protein [Streptosporangium sp. NBC_01755]WSD01521.1 YqaJ viral recombinase family protein [Streptosporangium sp. NBC_01755]